MSENNSQNQSSHDSDYESCEDSFDIINDESQQDEKSQQDKKSQQDEKQNIQLQEDDEKYGCAHYPTKCEIQAPCCNIWYICRLCHNEKYKGPKAPGCKVETMDRGAVQLVRCLICKTEQKPQQECESCTVQFSRYYCNICKLFDDTPNKQIYHCDKCGICRIGNPKYIKHCDICVMCFPISNQHKCKEQASQSNCPICLENLFNSRLSMTQLDKCGHWVHVDCLNDYYKQGIGYRNCPLCGASTHKENDEFIKQIDQMVEQTKNQLPPEFVNKKCNIYCNNCQQKTLDVQFNFYGLKCSHCGSYNTKE